MVFSPSTTRNTEFINDTVKFKICEQEKIDTFFYILTIANNTHQSIKQFQLYKIPLNKLLNSDFYLHEHSV